MKANAPEKIYYTPYGDIREDAPMTDNDLVYVRPDAFVEKACKWLKENKDKYLYNTGERNEYIPTCSTKMIEEFRNYMKGE